MSVVVCKLPKAGLGNQLFPLMKACVFSHLNGLKLVVTGYHQLKMGPYLRGDRSKRNYRGYFTFQKGIMYELLDTLALLQYRRYNIRNEYPIERQRAHSQKNIFLFHNLPHWSDYFKELKEYRELVIRLFWSMLTPEVRNELDKYNTPCIGVHIRMGDYRKLKPGEDFSKVGFVRTPEQYFTDVITKMRQVAGSNLPVSVFTDGYEHELEHLLSLDNISVVKGNPDIIDLLLLSKSRLIITSAGSTFSYWAGFLSDAPLIMHPDHIHQSIRPAAMGVDVYEGKFDQHHPVLIHNIKCIT